MNKTFKLALISGLLVLLIGMATLPVDAANPSYVVYGQISIGSTPTNGIKVTITNMNTSQSLNVTSGTDSFGNKGIYQGNLGNLGIQWQRGNTIRVSATSSSYAGTTDFIIPANGTIYEVNLILSSTGRRGSRERGPGGEAVFGLPLLLIIAAVLVMIILAFLYISREQ